MLPEANIRHPRVWKSPARHLVSLFSEKRPGHSTTPLYYSWVSSTHSFPPLPAGALLPAAQCQQASRLCCTPSPCPLCSWILPLTLSPHCQSLRPAHAQKHTAWSCPGWLVFASPPLQGSQSHKQASWVSYAFFLTFAIPQEHLHQIQGCLRLSHRQSKGCRVSLEHAQHSPEPAATCVCVCVTWGWPKQSQGETQHGSKPGSPAGFPAESSKEAERLLGAESKLGRRGKNNLPNFLNLQLSHMPRGDAILAGSSTHAQETAGPRIPLIYSKPSGRHVPFSPGDDSRAASLGRNDEITLNFSCCQSSLEHVARHQLQELPAGAFAGGAGPVYWAVPAQPECQTPLKRA